MMKRLAFLLNLTFLLQISLVAQTTVSGVIYDDELDEPLIGANVIIQGTSIGTSTDLDGNFALQSNEPLPWTLEISYTGYEGQTIEVTGSTSAINIRLASSVIVGQEVVVSASRRREKVQEAPASISVVNAKKLETSANPADATRNLINTAGVQIQQQSANRINISMRGGSGLFGTSVFPIMDYRSLVGPGVGTFQSDQAGIMNLDLERIEVVRGPGSALYGPGVTQGVVHFITKSPIDKPGTSIELMGGELSTFGGAIRHATKVSDKFGFKINVQHRQGDEFEYAPDDPYIQNILPDQGQGRGLYRPAVVGGIADASVPPTLLKSFETLDGDSNGNPMQQRWDNTAINTTLEFRPSDDLSLNLSGGFNSASSLFFNEQGPGMANANEYWAQARVQAGGFFGQIFYLDNAGERGDDPTFLYKTGNVTTVARNQLEAQLQYNFDTPTFLNANWTAGFDYRFSGQGTENLTYGRNEDDDDFSIIGGYLQGKIPVGSKVDLVLAGRYDQFNFIDEGAFSPRAALVYKVNPRHTLRASWNRANSTVSNLQLNIDFPLNTIIPGSFDVWLYGNKTEQTFGSNPTIDWFTGLIPSLPVGTPGAGLPLGVITQTEVTPGVTVNQAVIGQLVAGLNANPATAPAAPLVQNVLANLDPATLGFGGALSPGFNIFDGSPLGLQNAPISTIAIADNVEVGYKGLIADKLGASLDVFWVREDNNSQFTAISPAYTLTGIDGISGDLGAAVQAQAQPQIEQGLIAAGFDAATAGALAGQLGAVINDAYTSGGDLVLNTPSDAFGGASLTQVLTALPFHATTPTEQVPQNGVTHLAAGYRTFDARDYYGADLGLEYYVNEDFTIYGNYSWLSDTEFMQRVVGSPEGSDLLPTALNVPANKFRLGFNYAPEFGFRTQVGFQHDDAFNANAGDFSGRTTERNLVDASVGYKFNNGLSLDVTATNLFDSEYRYYPNMPIIGRRVLGKLTYHFGGAKVDSDGDGVADDKDMCPNTAGLKAFDGCPDSDGDGIKDSEDGCPLAAGPASSMGCPDSDGDGVIDKNDNCPNDAGTADGCPDADGDGIADKDDACPNSAGPLNGCPDSDGDGVADKDDNCPNAAGPAGGCPDRDNDGVADKDDACPDQRGTLANGCPADPDSDGDGVADSKDRCPNAAGPLNGCPDGDNDGIADRDDKCPTLGGNVTPDGCPVIPESVTEVFTRALQGIQFETGSNRIRSSSRGILDEVVTIMQQNPSYLLTIEGHTDSIGSSETNQTLSQRRADAVKIYLVEKGVPVNRITSIGYGESQPIADNKYAAGRKQNRRVELKVNYRQ